MKRFPWRGMLYLILLSYLFLDLKVFHGPLRSAMRDRRDAGMEEAKSLGYLALVNLEPITPEQLELAVTRYLYQRGKTKAEIPAKNLAMIRGAVLQSLIDDTLVRQYADGDKFEAPAAEIAAFIASWEGGFPSTETLARGAESQVLDDETLRSELSRIWSRTRWLEKRISPAVIVTEEEAKEWFEANREASEETAEETQEGLRPGFYEPEKIHIRHRLFHPNEEQLAHDTYTRLRTQAASGAEAQDDSITSGWIARQADQAAWAEAIFASEETGFFPPFQTERGWHLLEVLERQAARALTYEEMLPEIIAHLEAERSEAIVKILMEKLRTVANLQIFVENLQAIP